MSQKTKSTFAVTDPTEILEALVGLKDVRVLAYQRRAKDVDLMIEQVVLDPRCPSCRGPAQIKERPVITYIDLPVYGTPMRLSWRKHRMVCVDQRCSQRSFVLQDHRIAAKSCLLTTRAAKWATVQVGTGRTVSEVAKELDCDWHTVNDAVTTYGTALLNADHRRMNKTIAIGLDEPTSNLSPNVVEELLFVLIPALAAEARSIVIVEQAVEAALSIADRACLVSNGRMLRYGDAQEMLEVVTTHGLLAESL